MKKITDKSVDPKYVIAPDKNGVDRILPYNGAAKKREEQKKNEERKKVKIRLISLGAAITMLTSSLVYSLVKKKYTDSMPQVRQEQRVDDTQRLGSPWEREDHYLDEYNIEIYSQIAKKIVTGDYDEDDIELLEEVLYAINSHDGTIILPPYNSNVGYGNCSLIYEVDEDGHFVGFTRQDINPKFKCRGFAEAEMDQKRRMESFISLMMREPFAGGFATPDDLFFTQEELKGEVSVHSNEELMRRLIMLVELRYRLDMIKTPEVYHYSSETYHYSHLPTISDRSRFLHKNLYYQKRELTEMVDERIQHIMRVLKNRLQDKKIH